MNTKPAFTLHINEVVRFTVRSDAVVMEDLDGTVVIPVDSIVEFLARLERFLSAGIEGRVNDADPQITLTDGNGSGFLALSAGVKGLLLEYHEHFTGLGTGWQLIADECRMLHERIAPLACECAILGRFPSEQWNGGPSDNLFDANNGMAA